MNGRVSFATFALAALSIGCDRAKREKAVADSLIAVAAADDSARLAAGATKTLGRDSVRVGATIMGLPTVSDTAQRRPPR